MPALDHDALDALPDGAPVFAVLVYTDHDGSRYLMHGGRSELDVYVQPSADCPDGYKFLSLRPDTTGACFDFDHLSGTTFLQGSDWRATFYDNAEDARDDFEAELARGTKQVPEFID